MKRKRKRSTNRSGIVSTTVSTRELPTRGQLIVHEVHRPDLVRARRWPAVLAQLGLDPASWRFVVQLQAHLAIQPSDTLGVHAQMPSEMKRLRQLEDEESPNQVVFQ
jgi:hypothetical protein